MIVIGSDNPVNLTGLIDNISGSYVNGATVNGKLLDNTGATIISFSLSYVAASNGNYQGNIPNTTVLVSGALYRIQVTATNGSFVRIFDHDEFAGVSVT